MGETSSTTLTQELIPVTDNDSSDHPSIPLHERLRKKIAVVRWKAFFIALMILIDNFLLLCSISLISVFYPIEVNGWLGDDITIPL